MTRISRSSLEAFKEKLTSPAPSRPRTPSSPLPPCFRGRSRSILLLHSLPLGGIEAARHRQRRSATGREAAWRCPEGGLISWRNEGDLASNDVLTTARACVMKVFSKYYFRSANYLEMHSMRVRTNLVTAHDTIVSQDSRANDFRIRFTIPIMEARFSQP